VIGPTPGRKGYGPLKPATSVPRTPTAPLRRMRDICRFLRIDIQAPPSVPIYL
jgi:hypothetical protein